MAEKKNRRSDSPIIFVRFIFFLRFLLFFFFHRFFLFLFSFTIFFICLPICFLLQFIVKTDSSLLIIFPLNSPFNLALIHRIESPFHRHYFLSRVLWIASILIKNGKKRSIRSKSLNNFDLMERINSIIIRAQVMREQFWRWRKIQLDLKERIGSIIVRARDYARLSGLLDFMGGSAPSWYGTM